MRYDTAADLLRGNRAFKLAQSEGTNTLLEVDGMEVTGLRLPEPTHAALPHP